MKKLSSFFTTAFLVATIFLGFVFTVGGFSGVARADGFSDVAQNYEHYAAIQYLQSKGIISGYSDGTFKPDQPITRAESLKILLLATGTALNSTQTINFPDVSQSDWFYPYVRKADELKIVSGYPDGNFYPNNTINLAESLKVILITFQANVAQTVSADPYPDVGTDTWYAPYADYAKQKTLIEPQDDGDLHAESDMSRAQFAEIVYRLMYIHDKSLDTFPLSLNWPVFTHPTENYSIEYPFGWQVIPAGTHTIFWKQDVGNAQMSFARIFPNSASVYTVVDPNKNQLTLDQYIQKLQYGSAAVIDKNTLNGYPYESITISDNGLQDFYFQLPNNTILIVYTQMGSGPLHPLLDEEIRFMVGTVRYNATNPSSPDTAASTSLASAASTSATQAQSGSSTQQDLLSQIRLNLLIQGVGKSYLNQLPDAQIISTDTIGIGTGPVDYYYSQTYNVTIKYERNSDTLLAIKDGKTTAF